MTNNARKTPPNVVAAIKKYRQTRDAITFYLPKGTKAKFRSWLKEQGTDATKFLTAVVDDILENHAGYAPGEASDGNAQD